MINSLFVHLFIWSETSFRALITILLWRLVRKVTHNQANAVLALFGPHGVK
jgi:hypothetical protein